MYAVCVVVCVLAAEGFTMAVLAVLGLQLCLFAFGVEVNALPPWAVPESNPEMQVSLPEPPTFEMGNGELHHPEEPEFGVEMKYQDHEDTDFMLMRHRERRSPGQEKKTKKIKKPNPGAYSTISMLSQDRSLEEKKTPAVSRAKRQLNAERKKNSRNGQKAIGKYSSIGSEQVPKQKTSE